MMRPDSKIYVAGHSGLVGSAIHRRLLSGGYRNIITRKSSELDLTRQTEVETFFEKELPEYVFLAAAKVGGILANSTYKAEFIYKNLMIASNVIHAACLYRAKKLLNLGSSCIYPKFAPQPMKEEHLLTGTLEPTNEPYAIAKIAAIKLCRYYNEQYGTNFLSGMPTNLYGPQDNFDLLDSHVLPAMIRKFHEAKKLHEEMKGEVEARQEKRQKKDRPEEPFPRVVLWGTGSPFREFLYVDDLADACVFLMERYDYKEIGELINIGTGNDITIKDLALMIRDVVGFQGEIVWDSTKPDGTPQKLLDVSMIANLGWESKTTLAEGIRKTYSWYLQELANRPQEEKTEKSSG
jgi:GDP-L-fucose synthase